MGLFIGIGKRRTNLFLKKQIDLEKMIVEEGNRSVRGFKNMLVRELIRGIALDSMKHTNMLEAMIALISGAKIFLTERGLMGNGLEILSISWSSRRLTLDFSEVR